MSRQQTIQREAELAGLGLFTGYPVRVRFKPSAPGSGIWFVRTDTPEPIRVQARIENLSKRARRTSLRNGVGTIETVEHCLSAIRGLEIDNLIVELDNAELPGVDGSGMPYVERLREAGVVQQDAERSVLNIAQIVRVTEGDAELVAWPGESGQLDVYYELDYPGTPIGHQIFHFALSKDDYIREIAPARTFVLEDEARQLRAAGLGTHLTAQDVLVIGPTGPIDNDYRFPNECVRHKILDLIGDLMLSGVFVCGRVYARKSGHSLNHELVNRLLEQRASEEFSRRLVSAPKIDVRAVQRILPHRYPMLLVDRVLELEADKRAVGIKNVTINEPFFEGHYPRHPIMPGVLVIEALAQLGGILLSQKLEHTGKIAMLLSLDRVKFRRPVVPGDQLILEVVSERVKTRTGQVQARARVGNELAAEAAIRFMLVDADPT